MKKILFFLIAAVAIIACGNAGTETEKKPTSKARTASATPPKADGKKIYKQYCITCHGLYGDMGASGAANLTESKLTVEERIQVITNGRKTMAAFKSLLNEEKIEAVAKYTMELTKNDEEEE
ncbi:MAG: cytochrome c [Saprospiraceae bacterium]|nr:cytochrome c [Saprospiraceae bacterium]